MEDEHNPINQKDWFKWMQLDFKEKPIQVSSKTCAGIDDLWLKIKKVGEKKLGNFKKIAESKVKIKNLKKK